MSLLDLNANIDFGETVIRAVKRWGLIPGRLENSIRFGGFFNSRLEQMEYDGENNYYVWYRVTVDRKGVIDGGIIYLIKDFTNHEQFPIWHRMHADNVGNSVSPKHIRLIINKTMSTNWSNIPADLEDILNYKPEYKYVFYQPTQNIWRDWY